MPLPVIEHTVNDDVRRIASQDDTENAFEIVHTPHFLPAALLNPAEVREPANAASPAWSLCVLFDRFAQLPGGKALEDTMLLKQVLELILGNLYTGTTTPSSCQGTPPMSAATDLRQEFTELIDSYFRGETSLSGYLTWEVEFTTSEDALIDPDLTGQAAGLSLLGHEFLIDLRPLADFETEARQFLDQSRSPSSQSEAAGG